MGVSGLLTLLRSIQKPCHLRDFAGKTLAVDAYGWLHRGAIACAIELAQGKPTRKHIAFAMHRVKMLKHFGVTPYIVFDGDRLPSKAATEKSRAQRRRESKAAGLELLRSGKVRSAYEELQKSVDVTPEMARALIEELKAIGVSYVVAPYEADAQMVYLEQQGIVDGILSEDSDLLVFGAKCLLTKLEKYGDCIMVNRDHFTRCREVNLTGWSLQEFRAMAILSGCDYLEGMNRMGLKTAHRLVRKYKTIDRILRGVTLENRLRVPANYAQDFTQAENTFLYQWVFCPNTERLVHLNALPRGLDVETLPYIGAHVEASVARGVAEGDLNPMTKQRIMISTSSTNPISASKLSEGQTQPTDSTKPSSKPIDSFFKPKRTPLAELDPNIMRLNPSQQRLLNAQEDLVNTQNNQQSPPAPPTASQPAEEAPQVRRHYSAPVRNVDAAPVPKKRRLCDDSPTKSKVQTERSRFFGADMAINDSAKRARKSRNNKIFSDFDIRSDDSVEGAMAQLADQEQLLSSKKRPVSLEVYRDSETSVVKEQAEESVDVKAAAEDVDNAPDAEESSPFSESLRSETKMMKLSTSISAFAHNPEAHGNLSMTSAHPSSSPPTLKSRMQTLATPPKPSTAPPRISHNDHTHPHTNADDVIFESPPSQPPTMFRPVDNPAEYLKFPTPSWLPEQDSGYGSQLEAYVPELKGSEDCLLPHSDDSRVEVPGSSPVDGKAGLFTSRKSVGDSEEEDEGVGLEDDDHEERPARMLDLRAFAFGA